MAPPASDRERTGLTGVLRLLAPYPGRTDFALRVAFLCALTTLVVELYHTPEPALTAYVSFFVVKPDRMGSILVSIIFVLLISVVVGALLLIVKAVIDSPVARVSAMTLASLVMLFLGSATKLRPVAPIVTLIVAYGLDVLARVQIAEVATRAVLYVWLFVTIPAGLSIVLNMLFGPAPRRLAEQALAQRLRLCAEMLGAPSARTREAFAEVLAEGPGEVPAWLKLAALERTASAPHLAALGQAAASTTEILLLTDLIARETTTDALAAPWLQTLAHDLDQMAAILEAGSYPVDIEAGEGQDAAGPLGAAVAAELRQTLAGFAEAPPPPKAKPAAKTGVGFFLPDAFTNPAHIQYALKTTGAAMFCYIVYSLLNWPGIHTCLITCYIVSLDTAAETIEKLALRFTGCLVGAAAGIAAIVFVMPNVTTITGLLAVVFPAALVSAWIAGGGPRIGYAGFQLAFAFFLSVIQGSSPGFDMTIARDRTIGILFGNVVAYVVFTRIWPVSVARRIDPAIVALVKGLSAIAAAPGRAARASLVLKARAAQAALAQDLALARYEPPGLRAPEPWLRARRQAAGEMAALDGPLLLCADQAPDVGARAAARLDELAERFGAQAGSAPAVAETAPPAGPLRSERSSEAIRTLVDRHVRKLELALAEPLADARADHATA